LLALAFERPKQRHDPIAHHLVHGALIAMHGENLPRLFGVAIGEQFHRALQVCEQNRHLFALTFQRGLGREDSLGEVLGDVGLRR